jgi:small subunit ribosomal protein S21
MVHVVRAPLFLNIQQKQRNARAFCEKGFYDKEDARDENRKKRQKKTCEKRLNHYYRRAQNELSCRVWHDHADKGYIREMIKVKARGSESVEQMIRRFKKMCEKEGLVRDLKRRSYYEKPSEIRRRRRRKTSKRPE